MSLSHKDQPHGSRGHSRHGSRHDPMGPHAIDVDDAPPPSDADVCIPATSSAPRSASALAAVSGGNLLFLHFDTFSNFFHFKLQFSLNLLFSSMSSTLLYFSSLCHCCASKRPHVNAIDSIN